MVIWKVGGVACSLRCSCCYTVCFLCESDIGVGIDIVRPFVAEVEVVVAVVISLGLVMC